MNATVTIHNPAAATTGWDPDTESATSVPGAPVYDGPARIQANDQASDAQQTGQSVTERSYLVQLVFDAPHIEKGHEITVTECANDTDLVAWTVDRPMVVTDVQHGSERFTRSMVTNCSQSTRANNASAPATPASATSGERGHCHASQAMVASALKKTTTCCQRAFMESGVSL